MSPRVRILKTIQQNSIELKAYGVKRIGLFGSFACAHQHEKSDMDFLVEFDRGAKTFDNYMGLKFYLEEIFHRKIDLVIKGTLKPRIKDRVLSEVHYA